MYGHCSMKTLEPKSGKLWPKGSPTLAEEGDVQGTSTLSPGPGAPRHHWFGRCSSLFIPLLRDLARSARQAPAGSSAYEPLLCQGRGWRAVGDAAPASTLTAAATQQT